jgi:hypothetical protein
MIIIRSIPKLPIVVATALALPATRTLRFSCLTSARHPRALFAHSLSSLDHVFKQHQGHLSVSYSPPAPLSLSTHNHAVKSDLRVNRFRPPNSLELREGSDIIVSFDDNLQTVQLRSAQVSSGPEKDGFSFDRVFPMGTKQDEVFDYGVKE